MLDSVNPLILAEGRVAKEDISEQLENYVCTTYKIVNDSFAFFKASFHWVCPGQFKASYCSKNSRNHQSDWLITAVTSLLQSKSGYL